MTDHIEKLAKTLNRRMHAVSLGHSDTTAEIGEIVSGKSLQVPSVDDKIPSDQYLILHHTIKLTESVTVTVKTASNHTHPALIETGTKIIGDDVYDVGDVVLVVWANDEPVIVGRVD